VGSSEPDESSSTVIGPLACAVGNENDPTSSSHRLSSDIAVSKPQLAAVLVRDFPRVWRVARRMGLSVEQAEEATQEAFVVMLQKLDPIEPGKELAFLFSTVTNISLNLRRKAGFSREIPHAPELLERVANSATNLDLVEQKQAKELVDDILAKLSERLRVVFVLYELEQLTLQEISVILGIPLGTAGSRLRLAREAFQSELAERSKRRRPYEVEP